MRTFYRLHKEQEVDGKWVYVGAIPVTFDSNLTWITGGFGWIYTSINIGEIRPISMQRGLPKDRTAEVKIRRTEELRGSRREYRNNITYSTTWAHQKEVEDYVNSLSSLPKRLAYIKDELMFILEQMKVCTAHEDCEKYPELGRACLGSGKMRLIYWFHWV